jgi:signal transduction histidine kinase
VRIACTALLVAYTAIALVRHEPRHPEFALVRGGVCVLALAGICLARRLTWAGLRTYTVALALLLPLGATYVDGVRGHDVPDLLMTALATFTPLVFLQTSCDILLVTAGLAAGNALLLAILPPPAAPFSTVCVLLGGATASGAVAGLTMVITRAGLREGMMWWQQACERERALREFAEVTVSSRGDEALAEHLGHRLLASFGTGRCAIVLSDPAGEGFRVAAAVGFDAEGAAALAKEPLSPVLTALLRRMIEQGHPLVREHLTEEQRSEMAARWGQPIQARSLVALPLVVEEMVAGLAVLTASEPRPVPRDRLLLWQAMVNQAGVALANTRLLAHLERALRAKNEFLNTMSHELRSPLHVIIGYADMLREDAADAEARATGTRIRTSALELLSLVEDAMTVSRFEAGRVTVRSDEFTAAEVVEELRESVATLPEAAGGVPVSWEVGPDIPALRLDRLKVKEIVQNLVSNALKFTAEGRVAVTVDRDADRLRIAVEDTGVGIPPEAQTRIFDMFERVEHPGGRQVPGVGLGLYIVQRLVRLLEGTIELASAQGAGSRFTVRLPLRLA